MTWLQRYRLRHYVRNSIWVFPALAIVLAMVLVRMIHGLEEELGWVGTASPDAVRTVLGALAGSMFTFVVFVCSSLLLVVQLASAQLTPRMIGVLFRDSVTKVTLSMFVFSFTFSMSVIIRISDRVPLLTVQIAGWSSALCLALFLYLIDHVGKLLRPSGALRSIAVPGHKVIDEVYPHRLKEHLSSTSVILSELQKAPTRSITCTSAGVVLAFDVRGLVALSTRHDGVIELVPQVGDFAAPGDALFRVHGGTDLPNDALQQSIALGAERNIGQDPALAFRIIVDIASKVLSPAINDPTTAVLAIDQIHHLLRHLGKRRLDNEKVRDASGRVRLIYRTPDWEDFVALAVTEIRHFGGNSIQIARRLRAMLEDLIRTLPEERAAPLRQELMLLHKSAERFFEEPEDRALAEVGDSQGVGGA